MEDGDDDEREDDEDEDVDDDDEFVLAAIFCMSRSWACWMRLRCCTQKSFGL